MHFVSIISIKDNFYLFSTSLDLAVLTYPTKKYSTSLITRHVDFKVPILGSNGFPLKLQFSSDGLISTLISQL